MNKVTFILKIIKDRWFRPYDNITVRFNTKAEEGNPLVWRIFINGQEMLASSFEIQGYVYDVVSYEHGVKKLNVGCKGRIRWSGSKAVIFACKKEPDILL
jgi:hypothetical protein